MDDNVSATTSSFDLMSSNVHSTTLLDLFWTLYAKVLAVLEGHRIIFEASRSISIVSFVLEDSLTSRDEISRTARPHPYPHPCWIYGVRYNKR